MNTSTANSLKYNLLIATMGTAILAPVYYEPSQAILPTQNLSYKQLAINSWGSSALSSPYSPVAKIEIITTFSKRLLENSRDIDADILDVIDDIYWDLL